MFQGRWSTAWGVTGEMERCRGDYTGEGVLRVGAAHITLEGTMEVPELDHDG